MTTAINNPGDSSVRGWVHRFSQASAAVPMLVCFPHAGGSASFYFPMSQELVQRFDLMAVQYPGRQERRREQPPKSIESLAGQISQAFRDAEWPERYAFFGHSMGAIVAYEVARDLQESGVRGPDLLVVSGRRAPSVQRDDHVRKMSDAQFTSHISQLGGTDPRLLADPEFRDMILPVARADYRAIETHTSAPDPRLRCSILALTGDSDLGAVPGEVAAWERHTTGGFDMAVFAGGHFYLQNQLPGVTRAIERAMNTIAIG